MKITPPQRRAVLFVIAIGLAALVILDGDDANRAVSAAPAPRVAGTRVKGAGAPLPDIKLEKLDEKIARAPVSDAFEVRSWEPPAPKIKKPPPPPPQAPPLPYTYVGKIMEGSRVIVFLAKHNRNYVVKLGETIDGAYRVDEIRGDTMTLTYLPLDQKQTLAIGAAN